MNLRSALVHSPQRLASGACIFHSGLGTWKGGPQQAEYVHAAASGAFPFLRDVPPARFLKAVTVGEMARERCSSRRSCPTGSPVPH